MNTAELQIQIFQYIKNKLPSHLSMVDEVAAILDVSTDSAYRRIRGEKALSLEELYKLSSRFQLSLDQMLNLQSDVLVFGGSFIHPQNFEFDQYLKSAIQHVKYMTSFKQRKLFYLCKDVPLFHHFHFREIAAFKHYVWMKGIFNAPGFLNKKFRIADYPDELFDLGTKALSIYNEIDCVEIWNVENINSSLRQIDYYHDMGMFANEKEVIMIYEAYEKLVTHLDQQAGLGFKFNIGGPKTETSGSYEMYLNEIVIGDNSLLAMLDGAKISFIIHSVINIMTTRDLRFCDNMYECIQNLIKRSTQISSVSERERSRFFKYLRNRIAGRKESIRS
jgi:hypothetical protein